MSDDARITGVPGEIAPNLSAGNFAGKSILLPTMIVLAASSARADERASAVCAAASAAVASGVARPTARRPVTSVAAVT